MSTCEKSFENTTNDNNFVLMSTRLVFFTFLTKEFSTYFTAEWFKAAARGE